MTLGPGVDVGPGHLLKLMVEDFDLSLLGNMSENLGYILTVAHSKYKKWQRKMSFSVIICVRNPSTQEGHKTLHIQLK